MKKMINFIALTLCFVASTATAEWEMLSEHWYGVTIDGAKSGHVHQIYEQKDFEIRSTNVQEMTLSRAGIELQIKVHTVFTETVDGKPVSVVTTQEAMGQVSKTTWLFKDGKIMTISEAGGEPVQKIVDAPAKNWLTPQAVKRLFVQKMREDQPIISYVMMSPELGLNPVTVVLTKLGTETVEVMGQDTEVVKYESANNVLPVASNEWYTREGLNVGSEMNAGFGAIRNTLMSKLDALAPVNEVPELMISMFVEPNHPIPESEDLSRLVMKVKSKDGSKVELPNSGHQFVTANEDGTATVIVDLNKAVPATSGEIDSPSYMAATAICDASDEAVIAIATETLATLPQDASDLYKAKALRAKVFDFIDNKGLSTAFASASQTARDKKGDCSEHGVLLCGVLRAAGIPSRGVMGLVYVPLLKENGVFGWHMWSQALIDGHWIDLDATLETVHSVGHITTLTTSLSDENLNADMAGLMGTLGNLEVEIVEIVESSQGLTRSQLLEVQQNTDSMPGVKVTGEPKKSKSGLQWFDIVEGKGVMPPDNKTTVEVHYTGWLIDGTKFDSSVDRGKSISFPLNRVIKGWTEGVGSMKVGGKRKLVIPPHLGYGSKGAGEVIPPNATLIFDVELISISCNQVPTQEEVDRLKKKAEMYKTDTLVFKGFYLGMPIQDAAALLRYYTKSKDIKVENGMLAITTNVQGFSSAFECVYADDNGNVITFYFTEDLIKQIWNLNDMPRLEFLQRFMKNYSIPELTPTQVTWTGLRDGLSADIGIQTKYSYRSAKGFEVNFFEVMQGYDTRTVLGNDLLQNREKSGCGRDKSMLVKMIQTESERTSNFD